MALACPFHEHPVGSGTFCRICGRDYVDVPDPVGAELVTVGAPVEQLSAELPTAAFELPTAAFEPPAAVFALPLVDELPPVLPQQQQAAEVADALPTAVPLEAEEPAKSRSSLGGTSSPTALAAVAGFGGGALVMALLDRLVL
jgi:hypothetical protein